MNRRTKVIIVLIVAMLAMAGPSLVWYMRNGERVDPPAAQESVNIKAEQDKQ